jgi:hypothetical protein
VVTIPKLVLFRTNDFSGDKGLNMTHNLFQQGRDKIKKVERPKLAYNDIKSGKRSLKCD